MTRPQRYTGPELSALLREVRSELGDHATIHEANRIRTGGIAGFFRSEAFEVLASPPNGLERLAGAVQEPFDDPFAGTIFADSAFSDSAVSRETFSRETFSREMPSRETLSEGILSEGILSEGILSEETLSDEYDADNDLVTQLTAAMRSERGGASSTGATITRSPARRFGPDDLAPVDDDLDLIAPATSGTSTIGESLTPGQALLDRAESISTDERIDQLLRAARPIGSKPPAIPRRNPSHVPTTLTPTTLTPTTLTPTTLTPTDDSAFSDLLCRKLTASPLSTEPIITASIRTSTTVEPTGTPRPLERRPPRPAPPVLHAPTPQPAALSAAPTDRSAAPAADFWAELSRLEGELRPDVALDAATQLVVGPLDIALPLARRVIDGRTDAELTVLTDEVALAGVATWSLAENSRDLLGRLTHWTEEGRRCVGVIEAGGAGWADGDVDAPVLTARLMGVIERMCAGSVVGLLRLALRTLPPLADLSDLAGSLTVSWVLDLATAPSPAELDTAIAAGVPISSICGRPLTPALVMALRQR